MENKSYSKGWNAGRRYAWPEHRPPIPPDPIIGKIVSTARSLRDEADSFIATLDEDDPMAIKLADRIDAFDQAMVALTRHLASSDLRD